MPGLLLVRGQAARLGAGAGVQRADQAGAEAGDDVGEQRGHEGVGAHPERLLAPAALHALRVQRAHADGQPPSRAASGPAAGPFPHDGAASSAVCELYGPAEVRAERMTGRHP